jgi:hypothetical protein
MKPNKVLKSFDQLPAELLAVEPENSQPNEPAQAKPPTEKPPPLRPAHFPNGSGVRGYEGWGINE